MTRASLLSLPTLLLVAGCAPYETFDEHTPPPADAIVAWNERILSAAEAEDGFLTLKGVRAAAMMHLAMHDALAMIEPRFEPFVRVTAALHADTAAADRIAGVDPVAAVSEAAYQVAISQYPDQDDGFALERLRWRRDSEQVSAADPAREIGRRAAQGILQSRHDDGWDAEPDYQWHPMGPGVYAEFNEHSGTPEGFVFGAGWATARPFMMGSPRRFRSPPPPDIASAAYTQAFDEVKEVGARESATRTADQAHLAMWWKEFVEKSHNRLARELATGDEIDLWAAARLFALLNMSIYDGYVASFDGKFFYNHWRPYTAIRWASNDGNPDTVEDPDWTNLHDHTYAFPSYPSAHGTVCAAAMTVLEDVFGGARPFEMTIREVDSAGPMSRSIPMVPPTRRFASFAEAAEECSVSRVYLGIHFRYDSEAGTRLGRQVGNLAVGDFLRPVRPGARPPPETSAPSPP